MVSLVLSAQPQTRVARRIRSGKKTRDGVISLKDRSDDNQELEQYLPQVYRFAVYMLRNHHAAQDVTQETMLRALRNEQEVRDTRRWLFQVAANLCRDHARRKATRLHATGSLKTDPIGTAPEPWFRLLQEESCAQIEQTIERLSGREQTVLYLSAFEQLPNSEIAEVLDLSPGAVKVALSRARRSVRETIIRQRQKERQA